MIASLRRLQTRAFNSKAIEWFKLVSVTGSTQILVQAVAFVSGILVVRLLPTEEYGLYTIANTLLGTMTLLSDGGISTGVMAQGGKVWQNREQLGEVLATGLALRRKFAIGSLLVSLPILIYLLHHHGASTPTAILISISLIPAFLAALSDNLLEIVPKLHQAITPLQANQALVAVWRLVLTGMSVFFFPFTFVAILASGLPRIYGNIRLRKIAETYVAKGQLPNGIVKKEILNVVKKILPGAVYYCVSGQITLWLISIFGNTRSVAELGALSRLSIVLTVFGTLFSTLVIPRFARLPEERSVLLRRFLQFVGVIILVSLCTTGFFYLFPRQVLFLLGKNYSGLSYELLLVIVGSCISFIWGVVFSLYSSRGWILNPIVAIFISLLAIISGITFFDVSSITGALYFNIYVAIIELTYHAGFGFYKISKIA